MDDYAEVHAVAGIPVLGPCNYYPYCHDAWFVLGVGNAEVREKLSSGMRGVKWYKAIHPQAFISTLETSIGEGTVVMAGAAINPCVAIGKGCSINICVSVDHDCWVGDYAYLSVVVHLIRTVKVSDRT